MDVSIPCGTAWPPGHPLLPAHWRSALRLLLVAGFMMTTACTPAPDNSTASPVSRARDFLSDLVARQRVPGVQYVHVDASGIVFEYHGGLADIRTARPMSADTTLMAYSMSKTLTAVAVLQLAETGAVALDAPVTRYVPDLPYGDRVTVRQLLAHTGGLPNPIPLRWVHAVDAHRSFDEVAALREVLSRHPTLRYEPGTRFAYSNIGYWLLGRVIEHVTGESFAAYMASHVFAPLQLTGSDAGYTITSPAGHATGYLERYSWLNLFKPWLIDRSLVGTYQGGWLEIRPHYPDGAAFGGVVSSARALGAFISDQLRSRSVLFGDGARQWLYTRVRTSTGEPVPMTLGWHVSERPGGETVFFKEGGGGGFHAMMRVYPAAGRGSVMMTNATGFNVGQALDTIDGILAAVPR